VTNRLGDPIARFMKEGEYRRHVTCGMAKLPGACGGEACFVRRSVCSERKRDEMGSGLLKAVLLQYNIIRRG
jgi:hypothetical protein